MTYMQESLLPKPTVHITFKRKFPVVYQGAPWSWKVMEFRKTIFQAWKVMENSKGHGKSWKSHGK